MSTLPNDMKSSAINESSMAIATSTAASSVNNSNTGSKEDLLFNDHCYQNGSAHVTPIDSMELSIEDSSSSSLGILPINIWSTNGSGSMSANGNCVSTNNGRQYSECQGHNQQEFWTLSPSLSPIGPSSDAIMMDEQRSLDPEEDYYYHDEEDVTMMTAEDTFTEDTIASLKENSEYPLVRLEFELAVFVLCVWFLIHLCVFINVDDCYSIVISVEANSR